jgi:drug/metabolite transporter (DMT)-like permease
MEPVWAASLAVLLTTESVSLPLVFGGALLLVANMVVATGSRRGARAPEGTHT